MKKIILLSGASAVGKTALMLHILNSFKQNNKPTVCKIDCLHTNDGEKIREHGIPCVVGLSEDICPDHFLVSNISELISWSDKHESDMLFIETAGLCNRCSPATKNMISGCVIDATSSSYAPLGLGPMLTGADFVILTKIDLISQAEREIFCSQIKEINKTAKIFTVDSVAGYGIEPLINWISEKDFIKEYTEDILRFTMPSGVCSYCVGEKRVGDKWQQGVVGKIDFSEEIV